MIGVESVTALGDYFLEVEFENGETKYVDYKPFLTRGGLLSALSKKEAFKKVSVMPDGEGIEWSNGVDMSCIDLYETGVDELPIPRASVACTKTETTVISALKKLVNGKS